MTLHELQEQKKKLGCSDEMLADRSGIPLESVQLVMNGAIRIPDQKPLNVLAQVLKGEKNSAAGERSFLKEAKTAYQVVSPRYTIEDIYALPAGVRAELIDGKLYYMATPTRTHQKLAGEMFLAVANYIKACG